MKIINLVNVKVLFFLWIYLKEIFETVKTLLEIKMYYYLLLNQLYLLKCNLFEA